MISTWDFGFRPWTWDFYTWLVAEIAAGATGVNFRLKNAKSTKWPMEESIKRFWNFIEPGPREMAGLPSTIDSGGFETGRAHGAQALPPGFRRLALVNCPQTNGPRYTVTLRNTFHRVERNSDEKVWRAFAAQIGAHVIEDSAIEPIGLRERFTLYANADMNYGVPNGPVSTLWYTEYPLCMFSDPTNALSNKSWETQGIMIDDRMPWLMPNQYLVWQKPTLDNLLKAHAAVS